MQKYVVGMGRVRGEWTGFETEEIPNLVISKKLPSWAVWRTGNWVKGRREMQREEERGSQTTPQLLPLCLPFNQS